MIKNFIIVTFRNFLRQKSYSLINLLGLSIGLACSILIALFIFFELSYDRFHEKSDRIYRLYVDGKLGSEDLLSAWTAAPNAKAYLEEHPEIIEAIRVMRWSDVLFSIGDRHYLEDHVYFVDSTFLTMFDFPMIQGDPASVLKEPYTMVLTEDIAEKYFGSGDPVGKILKMNQDTTYYRVTGVVSNPPPNSHFEFDLLLSINSYERSRSESWLSNFLHTYFVVEQGTDIDKLEANMRETTAKYIGPQLEQVLGIGVEEFEAGGDSYGHFLQPLADIHLNTEIGHSMKPSNEKKYIYIFGAVAFFIILIACINYMNLATARSANRSREIGLRKVVGSGRGLIRRQFLVESVFMTVLALLIAIVFVEIALPGFNNIMGLDLSPEYFRKWYLIPALIVLAVFVGLLAGSYPAFYLSSFRPVNILSGKLQQGVKSGWLRSTLVVLQFCISIIIIVATIVTYRQLQYMMNKDLGFDKERLLLIQRASDLEGKIDLFKEEMKNLPGVTSITNSTAVPGYPNNHNGYQLEGQPTSNTYLMQTIWVDYDYLKTYGLELAEGRFFDPDLASDSSAAVINQAAVKAFNLENPMDNRFIQPGESMEDRTFHQVIGVVKDFHYVSLHHEIGPAVFLFKDPEWDWTGWLTIKLKPNTIKQTVKQIEDQWKELTNNKPFEYRFLDEDFDRRYQEEDRTRKLFTIFAIFALLVATLGLYGLAAFTTEQRTKEIGIRKVMGASLSRIVMLLSKETLILVSIATLIAWPVAYYFMRNWLQDFPYRIDIPWEVFPLSMILALIVALITVSAQALAAASRNPAESLRYE